MSKEDFDTLAFKDGRVFEQYSCPLIHDKGVVGRIWSFRDVTDRKRAEEKLRASEQRQAEAEKLAPVPSELTGKAPEGRLQQILYNLTVNAIYASPRNGYVNIATEPTDRNYVRIPRRLEVKK